MFYGQSVNCRPLDRCSIPFPSGNYGEFWHVKYCRGGGSKVTRQIGRGWCDDALLGLALENESFPL